MTAPHSPTFATAPTDPVVPDLASVPVTSSPPTTAATSYTEPLTQALARQQGGTLWGQCGRLIATWMPEERRWAVDWPAAAAIARTAKREETIALACAAGGPLRLVDVMVWADVYGCTTRHPRSYYADGRVRPEHTTGRWVAETGSGSTLQALGEHEALQEAERAVRDALMQRCDQLRQALHDSGNPSLVRVADTPWQDPHVTVLATQTHINRAQPWGIRDVARVCGVKRATVDQWRYRGLLPPPDDTGPAWYPITIIDWCRQSRRACDPTVLG